MMQEFTAAYRPLGKAVVLDKECLMLYSPFMAKLGYLSVSLAGVLFTSPAYAQLLLSPSQIVFNNYDETKTVILTNDGKPVLPSEINRIISGVFKSGNEVPETAPGSTHTSDYSFMFEINTNDDGSITFTPRRGDLELGSYDLIVHTDYGTVKGLIDANMREMFPPVPRPATTTPSFSYDIELPDYPYGQEISIALNPDEKNTYNWYIDGKLHSSGPGQTTFRALLDIGEYEISFIAHNPEGVVVSKWSDTVKIIE